MQLACDTATRDLSNCMSMEWQGTWCTTTDAMHICNHQMRGAKRPGAILKARRWRYMQITHACHRRIDESSRVQRAAAWT